MEDNTDRLEKICKQYLIEADGNVTVGYSLMTLEYSLIGNPIPVKDLEEFKYYLEK